LGALVYVGRWEGNEAIWLAVKVWGARQLLFNTHTQPNLSTAETASMGTAGLRQIRLDLC
jgi:hypothetical protein